MGTTTWFGLPYPESTDLVIQGDDAIQALAETVAARLAPDASLTVDPSTSGRAVGGATPVNITGATSAGSFTGDGDDFVYTGAANRFFIVCASVEVESSSAGTSTMTSTVHLLHNGAIIQRSFDRVDSIENTSEGTLRARSVVHNLTAPVQLATGGVIGLTAFSAPGGTIGSTSLRIYPIGPAFS